MGIAGAACAAEAVDPEWFFTVDDFTHPELTAAERRDINIEREYRAKLVCASCPSRAACLVAGREAEFGIFGGLGPERRRYLANRRDGDRSIPEQRVGAGADHPRSDDIVRAFQAGASVEQTSEKIGVERRVVVRALRRVALVGAS